jgi:hypothetical protein
VTADPADRRAMATAGRSGVDHRGDLVDVIGYRAVPVGCPLPVSAGAVETSGQRGRLRRGLGRLGCGGDGVPTGRRDS